MEARLTILTTLTTEVFDTLSYWLEREASEVNRINITPIVQDVIKSEKDFRFSVNEEKYIITRKILYINKAICFQTFYILGETIEELPDFTVLVKPGDRNSDSHTMTFLGGITYDLDQGAKGFFEKFFAKYLEDENTIFSKFSK